MENQVKGIRLKTGYTCCLDGPGGKISLPQREFIIALLSGLSLAISLILSNFRELPLILGWPLDPAWVAVLLCGVPIIRAAARAIIESFDIKAGLLIALALIAAVAVREIFAAGEVAFLMTLGELLEERTVRRSWAGLDRLLNIAPKLARVVTAAREEEMIPISKVKSGQLIRVRPGETVPVDGVVVSGQTAVDQSAITGESVPVDLLPGDSVLGGGLNRFGAFDLKATRVGEDSSLARLVRLVSEAGSHKAKLARVADRWATAIVPLAIILAVGVGLVTDDLIRTVSILIVFCPCGLVLATPTAVVAAIGAATKRGVLIRSGEALENLGLVTHMAFDKTGTLTLGKLKLERVKDFGFSEDYLITLAAAAESQSEHPLGQAVVRAARNRGLTFPDCENFSMEPGLGVSCTVGGHEVLAGRKILLTRHNLTLLPEMESAEAEFLAAGLTIVWLAEAGRIKGLLGLADTIRPEGRATVEAIKKEGLKLILLTGDQAQVATRVAGYLGLEEVQAGLWPDDKVWAIEMIQKSGVKLAMVGDGLNDAAALKTAAVGLAMGDIASDVTLEAADVVLFSGDLGAVPYLLRLSRRTLKIIRFNIAMAMGINLAAVVLAATGLMGPVLSALVHNLGAVLVVLNAIRLYNFKN
ncbi:MAG: hypothetical protein AMR96_02310 [Candidatus Adiutrix intracellularis]|jgi:heavy metal translocating P-type ATPase|nr:MAG: hypothetical protein AMR96_02310 [Candidatus Adiutrix intracellularis]MDR2827043.1 cation-translocating P-type ATPase [Candidatus Adiutrix intracellularis]